MCINDQHDGAKPKQVEDESAVDCAQEGNCCRKEIFASEMQQLKEQLLYAKADISNMQRRFEKERQQVVMYAKERMLQDILVLADDLDRLAQDMQHPAVTMMVKNMENFLSRQGLTVIPTQGMFDPMLHEALAQVPVVQDGDVVGTVAQTLQKGYMLSGHVIRPARVSVFA